MFQVEDLQDEMASALRSKRSAEGELAEANDRLQSIEIAKMEAENRISSLQKQVIILQLSCCMMVLVFAILKY